MVQGVQYLLDHPVIDHFLKSLSHSFFFLPKSSKNFVLTARQKTSNVSSSVRPNPSIQIGFRRNIVIRFQFSLVSGMVYFAVQSSSFLLGSYTIHKISLLVYDRTLRLSSISVEIHYFGDFSQFGFDSVPIISCSGRTLDVSADIVLNSFIRRFAFAVYRRQHPGAYSIVRGSNGVGERFFVDFGIESIVRMTSGPRGPCRGWSGRGC